MDRQALFDEFLDRQREHFHQWMENFTDYYHQIRSHLSSLSDKSNQRYLFFTVLFSFIFLTLFSLIIFEYRRLWKFIQQLFGYVRTFWIRIRNQFLRTTAPSLLNFFFFNSKSYFREKFSREFLRTLNEEFSHRKVIQQDLIIKSDLCFLICIPY